MTGAFSAWGVENRLCVECEEHRFTKLRLKEKLKIETEY